MSHPTNQHDTDQQDATSDEQVASLRQQLAARDREIKSIRRRYELDRLLRDAGAADLETTHLVLESRLGADTSDEESDLVTVVEELKESKPFLFGSGTVESPLFHLATLGGGDARSVASSPRIEPRADDHLTHAAAEAHITQKKSDLMRYLRLRRKFYQRE